MSGICQIIRNTIEREGAISFERFMTLALYHPEKGYYNTTNDPIGSQGDYYTMPHLTPAFGAMIARQLREMWEKLGQPARFTVVEVGAGNGHLCKSILRYAGSDAEFSNVLKYVIVEQSEYMRLRAKEIVPPCTELHSSLDTIQPFTGCIVSNELFDNIPFSCVVQKDELMEVYVDHDLDFFEILKPATEKIKNFILEAYLNLPRDFRMEVSTKSIDCLTQMAQKLLKGFIITIDYGHCNSDLLTASKSRGSLTCHHRHKVHDNPYLHVGEQDITSKVNFSTLSYFGKQHGLQIAGYVSQANFLRPLGLLAFLESNNCLQSSANPSASRFIANLLLTQPGNQFKVLIQYKGLQSPQLTGLRLRDMVRL